MKAFVSVLAMAIAQPSLALAVEAPTSISPQQLFAEISALDTAVFDAFNRCSDPVQLTKHASYFAEDVEFYHDTGGVTWNRHDMLANTKKYACGHFSRELVSGSLQVHPINGFGAIAQGTHRFCQFSSNTCDGEADFTMIWRQQDGVWLLTRVLSYGHKAVKPDN